MNLNSIRTCFKALTFIGFLFLASCSSLHTKADIERTKVTLFEAPKLFTAYNLWGKNRVVYAGSHRRGPMLPIGTEIISVRLESNELKTIFHYNTDRQTVVEEKKSMRDDFLPSYSDNISFITREGMEYEIAFSRRRHPGFTIFSYLNRILTAQDMNEKLSQYDDEILTAINQGAVVEAMTKQQVIYSVGYPMERFTPDYKRSSVWLYYPTKRQRGGSKLVEVCFNSDGYTAECMSAKVDNKVLLN